MPWARSGARSRQRGLEQRLGEATAADLDPEIRQTAAVAEVQRIFGVRTAAGLKQSIRKLSTELNREVRKHIDLSVGRMESKAYHQSRV